MRFVEVAIPAGKREAVRAALEEEGVDYTMVEETGSRAYTAVATFPLPTNAVEPVLDRLREAGLEDEAFTVVLDAESVTSRSFEALAERYAEAGEESRVARQELRTTAESLVSSLSAYLLLTVLSAVIATAGLLLDSPATVVGSMVIAPLIGPAMAASVGTVVDDDTLVSRGIRLQVIGIGIAVAAAAGFAFAVRTLNLVPPGLDPRTIGQVRERLSPDFLSLVVALGAGVAGAASLTTGVSSALVGVMIAVALIPPAATVGIGLAFGLPTVALSSGVLVLVNVLSINLAALLVFWHSGYAPPNLFRREEARSQTVKRVGVLLVSILVLSVFLGAVTYSTVTEAAAERQIGAEIERVLDDPAFDHATLLDTTITRTEGILFRQPDTVIVTVGVPTGESVPGLAERLDARLDATLDSDPAVEVRILETDVVQ
ncbi:MAG: TIGR00341 family protein [Halobacteriales archaeon]